MRCICLVQSPLQVINALEAIDFFNVDAPVFVTIKWEKRPKNYEQTVAQLPSDSEIITLYRDDSSSFNAVNYYASVLPRLNALKPDLLLIGDIRPYAFTDLARSIDCPHRVLLDDGTGTLVVYEHLVKNGVYYNLPKSSSAARQLERDQLKKEMGIKIDQSPAYDLYTCFELAPTQHSQIYKQALKRFAKKYSKLNDEQILIAGAPLVELNKLTSDDYVFIIEQMIENKSKNYVYAAHRNETDENLTILQKKFSDLKIIHPNQPLEIWLMCQDSPPATLYSIISTTLWNIYKAQPQVQVKAFIPSQSTWEKGVKKEAWGVAEVSSEQSMKLIAQYIKNFLPYKEVHCT